MSETTGDFRIFELPCLRIISWEIALVHVMTCCMKFKGTWHPHSAYNLSHHHGPQDSCHTAVVIPHEWHTRYERNSFVWDSIVCQSLLGRKESKSNPPPPPPPPRGFVLRVWEGVERFKQPKNMNMEWTSHWVHPLSQTMQLTRVRITLFSPTIRIVWSTLCKVCS